MYEDWVAYKSEVDKHNIHTLENVRERLDRDLNTLERITAANNMKSVLNWVPMVDEKKLAPKKRELTMVAKQRIHSRLMGKQKYFRVYCNYTTIHGFKYLGEEDTSRVEKLWWLMIMILSIALCGILIHTNYMKWERSPILITPSTSKTSIWQIPFPVVTVCLPITVKRNVYNFTALREQFERDENSLTAQEKRRLTLVEWYCKDVYVPNSDEEMDFLEEIGLQMDDVFEDCFWGTEDEEQNRNESCRDYFTPIEIGRSYKCFSFNVLDREDFFRDNWKYYKDMMNTGKRSSGWTLLNGYPPNSGIDAYPRRAITKDLTFTLKTPKVDSDPNCLDMKNFIVVFNHPMELPNENKDIPPLLISTNKQVQIKVTPHMSETSQDLRSYTPTKRNCYFAGEKRLAAFKIYSSLNCQMECLSNITAIACGCSNHLLAQLYNVPMCGIENLECVKIINQLFWAYGAGRDKMVQDDMFLKIFASDMVKIPNLDKMTYSDDIYCKCLPTCTTLRYQAEKQEFDKVEKVQQRGSPMANVSTNVVDEKTYVMITFPDYLFTIHQRKKMFEFIDFAANCGGLLGLFSGISFISIFEIIYFLTLRLWCQKGQKRNVWAS